LLVSAGPEFCFDALSLNFGRLQFRYLPAEFDNLSREFVLG
jgi:hypothetical protein